MKVCIATAKQHLGVLMITQGLHRLVGESNVDFFDGKNFTHPFFEKYDVLIALDDMLVGALRSYMIRTLENISKSSSTRLAICDFSDQNRLIRMPETISRLPYFKQQPMTKIPSLSYYLRNWVSINNFGNQLGLFEDYWGLFKSLRLSRNGNIFHLPPAYIEEPDVRPSSAKKYLVSLMVNLGLTDSIRVNVGQMLNTRNRVTTVAHLAKVPGSFVRLGYRHRSGLSHAEFLRISSESRAAVAPLYVTGGMGLSYRFFEIPYAGALLIAERPVSIIPSDFADGENMLFYQSMKELDAKVKFVAENPDSVKEMSKKGREIVMQNHSPLSRAKFIISKVNP
jgi:hypothetical protein